MPPATIAALEAAGADATAVPASSGGVAGACGNGRAGRVVAEAVASVWSASYCGSRPNFVGREPQAAHAAPIQMRHRMNGFKVHQGIASRTYDGERTAHVSPNTPAQKDTGRKWVRTDSQRTSLAPPQSTGSRRKDRERSHSVRDRHVGMGLVGRAALTRRRTNRRCRRNCRQMERIAATFEAIRQRAGGGGRAKPHGLPGLRLMTARRTC